MPGMQGFTYVTNQVPGDDKGRSSNPGGISAQGRPSLNYSRGFPLTRTSRLFYRPAPRCPPSGQGAGVSPGTRGSCLAAPSPHGPARPWTHTSALISSLCKQLTGLQAGTSHNGRSDTVNTPSHAPSPDSLHWLGHG